MTEAEWLTCEDLMKLLGHARRKKKLLTDRKFRLFAVACTRAVWEWLPGDPPPLGEVLVHHHPLEQPEPEASPPYLHDGRLLTLEDTVEFFNLVLQSRMSKEEKVDLVAFMQAL